MCRWGRIISLVRVLAQNISAEPQEIMTEPEIQRTEAEQEAVAIAGSEIAGSEPESLTSSAGQLESVTAWLGKTGSAVKEEVQRFVLCTCERAVHGSRSLLRHARESAAKMRQEKPLRVIAIVAGAAFLLGVGVAAWRERN